MALFGKKGKKGKKESKPAGESKSKKTVPVRVQVSPDIYTLFLGLSALFLIIASLVLGLNYYWYQMTEPAVLPLDAWLR